MFSVFRRGDRASPSDDFCYAKYKMNGRPRAWRERGEAGKLFHE